MQAVWMTRSTTRSCWPTGGSELREGDGQLWFRAGLLTWIGDMLFSAINFDSNSSMLYDNSYFGIRKGKSVVPLVLTLVARTDLVFMCLCLIGFGWVGHTVEVQGKTDSWQGSEGCSIIRSIIAWSCFYLRRLSLYTLRMLHVYIPNYSVSQKLALFG